MDLAELATLTRSLAGDPLIEGNDQAWTPEEIIEALNWAQDRYAEATECTFTEVGITSVTAGVISCPANAIKNVSVRTADATLSDPDADITVNSTAVAGESLTASVPPQAGASYFWTCAGGSITAGQGTAEVTVLAGSTVGAKMTIGVYVSLNGKSDSFSADVTLTA